MVLIRIAPQKIRKTRIIVALISVVIASTAMSWTTSAQEAYRQYVDVGVGDSFYYSWQSRYYSDRYDWFINITSIDLVAGGYQIWYSCGGDEHSILGPICHKFLGTNATVPFVPASYIPSGDAVLFVNKNQVKEAGSGESYIKYDDRGVLVEWNDYYGTIFLVVPSIFDIIPEWLFVILIGISVIIAAFVLEKVYEKKNFRKVMEEIEARWGSVSPRGVGAGSRGRWIPGEPER